MLQGVMEGTQYDNVVGQAAQHAACFWHWRITACLPCPFMPPPRIDSIPPLPHPTPPTPTPQIHLPGGYSGWPVDTRDTCVRVRGHPEALCHAWKNDNMGPHNVTEVCVWEGVANLSWCRSARGAVPCLKE